MLERCCDLICPEFDKSQRMQVLVQLRYRHPPVAGDEPLDQAFHPQLPALVYHRSPPPCGTVQLFMQGNYAGACY
jgi:hypothetical protein